MYAFMFKKTRAHKEILNEPSIVGGTCCKCRNLMEIFVKNAWNQGKNEGECGFYRGKHWEEIAAI